ncbi:MAG: hypothetical protein R3C12_11420 [Planctomycetaceae bacterium]
MPAAECTLRADVVGSTESTGYRLFDGSMLARSGHWVREVCGAWRSRDCTDSCLCEGYLENEPCCGELPDAACGLAELNESRYACLSSSRRLAIVRLARRYSCECHPEVLQALGDALSDCNTRSVAAADDLGDQLRRYAYCCPPWVIIKLQCAHNDCSPRVRLKSSEALRLCGYNSDGCEDTCCVDDHCLAVNVWPNPFTRNYPGGRFSLRHLSPADRSWQSLPGGLFPLESPRNRSAEDAPLPEKIVPRRGAYVPEEDSAEFQMPRRSPRELIGFRD